MSASIINFFVESLGLYILVHVSLMLKLISHFIMFVTLFHVESKSLYCIFICNDLFIMTIYLQK